MQHEMAAAWVVVGALFMIRGDIHPNLKARPWCNIVGWFIIVIASAQGIH